MFLTLDDVKAALALDTIGIRTDFDLNPDVRAEQLGIHKERPAAVLCGLRPAADGLRVVLTQRAAHLNHHAGQVAFPGGKVDPDDLTDHHTALREAEEEIGLPRAGVEIIGTLDAYLTSTGFRVTPVVGVIAPDWTPVPDPGEVEEVFEPPLDFLMNPANRVRHHHDRLGYRRYFYAMPWEGRYIWGATAGMLKGLSDRIALVREGSA
ncbi:MAG: CoA pyrophosphatase [Pseudomonadota bacterium]